ncbi:hypothetical protein ASPBRDRAFT_57142 [Aspergillus brasiliensis CBS 101740]|uniref:Uncharacterized protein n=1 Tax=Aspergillus brasiliensis (strain CBS 101740 / IMI 381727 / IBT 21946) TaxID=767769 RepID=A0A1L9UCS4_ASPBC|nr:hypothetical protein ASPBRDRAFT_57142 [Aspergillus brasiliensis CBS 101740]
MDDVVCRSNDKPRSDRSISLRSSRQSNQVRKQRKLKGWQGISNQPNTESGTGRSEPGLRKAIWNYPAVRLHSNRDAPRATATPSGPWRHPPVVFRRFWVDGGSKEPDGLPRQATHYNDDANGISKKPVGWEKSLVRSNRSIAGAGSS